jgi:hypothetical protein
MDLWKDALCRWMDEWMARSSVSTNQSALSMHDWMNEWNNRNMG